MARPSPYLSKPPEKALLIGFYATKRESYHRKFSLEELARLAETAGAVVGEKQLHELRSPTPGTLIGSGKIDEIARDITLKGFDILILDEDLAPTQQRNLEKALKVKVIDRTGLILDIFARHARSSEGKIQVELAQLSYLLPRLIGKGGELSQLGGGIGTRGPGETQLEVDRRKAKERVSVLKQELKCVRTHRELHRDRREKAPIATVAIVGYTNAGKSTLMNRLTHANVLVEDKLFATLDPTIRRLKLPSGRGVLLTDTVGFVRKLPHQLINAFRATFEEVASADLLIHLIDASHPDGVQQAEVVEKVLGEMNLHHKTCLRVFNKADQARETEFFAGRPGDFFISALTGEGTDALLQTIETSLSDSFRRLSLKLPYSAGSELSLLYRTSRILKRKDLSDAIYIEVELNDKYRNQFRRYITL